MNAETNNTNTIKPLYLSEAIHFQTSFVSDCGQVIRRKLMEKLFFLLLLLRIVIFFASRLQTTNCIKCVKSSRNT